MTVHTQIHLTIRLGFSLGVIPTGNVVIDYESRTSC